jgi:hypothetical protein
VQGQTRTFRDGKEAERGISTPTYLELHRFEFFKEWENLPIFHLYSTTSSMPPKKQHMKPFRVNVVFIFKISAVHQQLSKRENKKKLNEQEQQISRSVKNKEATEAFPPFPVI